MNSDSRSLIGKAVGHQDNRIELRITAATNEITIKQQKAIDYDGFLLIPL